MPLPAEISSCPAVSRPAPLRRLHTPPPALAFASFFVLLALRHPGMPFNAEFWGEDGWAWYPDAYNYGLVRLFHPLAGYLQTSSRLIGLLAQLVPLRWAPAVFGTTALAGQAAIAAFMLSPRLAPVWPSLRGRAVLALLYVALPNSWEVYGNATNLQWHLAVLSFMVVTSAPPSGWAGRVGELAALLISGLSGPFCLFLLPIAAWELVGRHDRTRAWRTAAVLLTVCVQAAIVFAAAGVRPDGSLGAGPWLFARIVSMQLFLGALFGENWMHRYVTWQVWQDNIMPVLVFVAGIGLCAVGWWRGSPLLRKAMVYSVLMLAAGLLRPNLGPLPWHALEIPATGARYFLIPMLVWVGVLLTLAADQAPALRAIGIALLTIMVVNLPGDWFYPDLPATGFQGAARAFERAPPGTTVALGINPYVQKMTLTRH